MYVHRYLGVCARVQYKTTLIKQTGLAQTQNFLNTSLKKPLHIAIKAP